MHRQLSASWLLVWLCLFSSAFSQSRYRVAAQIVGGVYVFNSENDLPITQDGKFIGGYGINASVMREETGPCSPSIDLQYYTSSAPMEFNYSLSGLPAIRGKLIIDQFIADAGLNYRITKWTLLGFGPSLAMARRTVDLPDKNIADGLNSYCAGVFCTAAMLSPLGKEGSSRLYSYYTLKLRYLHSLFFDTRGRNLGSYSQSFLTVSLGMGIGYAF